MVQWLGSHSCGQRERGDIPTLLPDLPPDEDPSLTKAKEQILKDKGDDVNQEEIDGGDGEGGGNLGANNEKSQQQVEVHHHEEEDEDIVRSQPPKLIIAINKEIQASQTNSNVALLTYLKKEDTDKTGYVDTEMFIKAVKRATSKLSKYKKIELNTLDALAIFNHYGKESDGRLDYKKFMKVLSNAAMADVSNDVGEKEKKGAVHNENDRDTFIKKSLLRSKIILL